GGTLESLPIRPGFWRANPTSTDIRRCWNPKACAGGRDPSSCAEGY
ncbi:unnamed protein product, partial [Chrysoparadoxa australica]